MTASISFVFVALVVLHNSLDLRTGQLYWRSS
jgi:hypothetical protein